MKDKYGWNEPPTKWDGLVTLAFHILSIGTAALAWIWGILDATREWREKNQSSSSSSSSRDLKR